MTQSPNQEALRERMEALVRRLVKHAPRSTAQDELWSEAHEIVAQLPPPVDPDLKHAEEIVRKRSVWLGGDTWYQRSVDAVLDGIRLGRELQRKEAQ